MSDASNAEAAGSLSTARPSRKGLATWFGGSAVAFLLMARDTQWRWSIPVGFVAVLVAALGALDVIGSFDDETNGTPATLALVPASATLFSLVATMSLMAHASTWVWGVAIAIGWIATCALGFKTLAALGIVDERERPLQQRHGFWLIVFCCCLYLPTLGAHSLIDPWETHYGEVSREVLARDDWITIWWAEEGFFVSKPILDFWTQALAMGLFGVHFKPDGMIAPPHIGGELQHPEWIVRFPSLTLSVVALYLAYRAVAHVRGRRAGLIAALVLATTGYWNMLSQQSTTDMPFVASLTAAMSLLMIGVTTDDAETVTAVPIKFGTKTFSVSGFHLAMLIILVCALPQALYLVSRNVTLVTQGAFGFDPHVDEFKTGSAYECWIGPSGGDSFERLMRIGKWPCEVKLPVHRGFAPALQGFSWMGVIAAILFINRNERRVSRLCFLVAWVFAGISTMGKGVAGVAVPILVAGAYVVTARKWRDLLRLELVSGVLVLACVAAPWFVAMWARMGDEFIQQLFVHHMLKRALDHVHDTNVGDDVSIRYFVWQLGYGLFPWTGLVGGGLVWWARKRWQPHEEKERDVTTFLVMWFLLCFALFTYMKTKFHHYVFPAVPPAALLTGLFLDDALGDDEDRFEKTMLGIVALAASVGTLLATRDLASRPAADIKGQERLIQLFTYRYDRSWPKELNFSSTLLWFGLLATVLTVALAAKALRRRAVVALVACAALFSAWTLDVYMMKIAPHWGQRSLFEAYYVDRRSAKEPIVAYDLNWKGENFYSGGRLVEFGNTSLPGPNVGERGNERLHTWLADMKQKTGAVYFVTEFSRVAKIDETLRQVLGPPPHGTRWTEPITTESVTNKFVVVRARWR